MIKRFLYFKYHKILTFSMLSQRIVIWLVDGGTSCAQISCDAIMYGDALRLSRVLTKPYRRKLAEPMILLL